MVEHQDDVLERLAQQMDKLKAEGDAAIEKFIVATIAYRSAFILDAVRSYLKSEANKAFGYLDEPRRLAFREEVVDYIARDPQRVRTWLESVSWPHRKKLFRDVDREFNKPSPDYGQLESTVGGLTDGLALILKRHGLGQARDTETVRKLHDSVAHAEKWSAEMNHAWDTVELVKKKIGEVERERDDRIALLAREKIAREIDELFLGTPDAVAAWMDRVVAHLKQCAPVDRPATQPS